jgi:Family of unknown function (DUF5519)
LSLPFHYPYLSFTYGPREHSIFNINLSYQERMTLATNIRPDTSSASHSFIHQDKAIVRTSSSILENMSPPTIAPFLPVDHPVRLIFLQLGVALSLLVLFGIGYKYIQQDYQKFLALGPGGTSYSFQGYTKLSFLSFFKLRNPYLAPKIPSRLRPQNGFLKGLQARQGCRPQLVGIAPQRQVTQNCSPAMVRALQATIRRLGDECPLHWYVSTSAIERHNEALFSKYKTFTEPDFYGEIVHSHASDGSMHLTLHPEDVKIVLSKGWGERHPLARDRTWWWHSPVPRGFMIIYGPRNRVELQQVKSIIRAAAWWVSGVDTRKEEHELQDAARPDMELEVYGEVEVSLGLEM